MAIIQFEDGKKVDFDGAPTEDDIAHVEQMLYGGMPAISSTSPKFGEGLPPGLSSQSAGREITPEEAKGHFSDLLPTRGELPEFGATLAGGAVAANLPARAGLALVGTMAAGAEGYRQVGQRIIGSPNAPQNSSEALGRMGGAFMRGSLSEGLGRGVQKLLTPFAGSVKPEILAAKKVAEDAGITPPLSTITDSKMVQGAERALEYTPFGTKITRQHEAALDGLKTMVEKVGKNIATDRPAEVSGALAKEVTAGLKESYRDATEKLYDQVMPSLKDVPVDTQNTISKLKEIISRRSGTGEPAGLGQVRQWLKEILPSREAGIPSMLIPDTVKEGSLKTFLDLRKFRTNIGRMGNFNDPAVSGLKSDLNELYGSVSKDLAQAAKGVSPDVYNGLAKADALFAEGKNTLKSKVFKAIQNVRQEDVWKTVIIPGSPTQAATGREILGNDVFRDISRQWFDDVVKQASPGGTVSPVKLSKALRKYESVIPEISDGSPELAKEFKKLLDVSDLLSRGRDVTKGSQTAYIASTVAPAIAFIQQVLTGNFKAAAGIGATVGAAKLGVEGLTSKAGREYLTRGFPRAGKVAARAVQPVAQIGLRSLSRTPYEE